MEIKYEKGATPLNPDELEGLKHPHIETQGELDQLEQQNIQDGFIWLSKQRKFKDYLNENFLLELHKQMLGDVWTWAGSYRHSDKNIGVDHLIIGVGLRNLLDDAKYWVEHATYSREEFAAHFHHRLVKIHSFPNGNGRHARIMTDLILEHVLKTNPVNWGSNLGVDGAHRETYINALKAADSNDYQPIIEFVSN